MPTPANRVRLLNPLAIPLLACDQAKSYKSGDSAADRPRPHGSAGIHASLESLIATPRPIGRGPIEAFSSSAARKSASWTPRPIGRGPIEA